MNTKSKILLPILGASALALSLAVVGCDNGTTDNTDPTDPVKYTVTYSTGEGTGTAPTSASYEVGEKFDLPQQGEMSKVDSTFDGWSYNSNKYAAGDEFTMPANDVTFTALWKANGTSTDPTDPTDPTTHFTVTYKAGEHGTGTPITQNKGVGGIISVANDLDLDVWTIETGYKICGWKIENDASNQVYAFFDDYDLTASVVFVAQYEETAELYSAYELDYKGIIVLDEGGTGRLLYGEERRADLTYTLSGTSITISIGGGNFTGTFTGDLLTINFTYASTTYRFGAFAPVAPVKPTVSFDANDGTGSAPVISDDDITYDSRLNQYIITLPQNTFTPPDNKVFKCWGTKGNEDLIYDVHGTTYRANSGENIVFYAVWEDDVSSVVVPTGTEFVGNCTVPEKNAPIGGLTVGGFTISKLWVNTSTDRIYYKLSAGDPDEIPSASITKSPYNNAYRPTKYGNDALYYEVIIKDVTLNILVKADGSELSLCDADDEFLDNCEFINERAEFTVTYIKPAGVTGDVPSVSTVTRGEQVTLAAGTVFAKEGWTFHKWKVSTYTAYCAPNTKIDVTTNIAITPIFQKSYSDINESGYGSLVLLDNGIAVMDGYDNNTYELDGNVAVIDYYDGYATIYFELDDATGNYYALDQWYVLEFTAKDGTTKLTFDGKGGAKLGNISGTYTFPQRYNYNKIELVIGGETYEIELEYVSGNDVINVLITVDEVDYIFGNPPIDYTISFELGEGVTGTAPTDIIGTGGSSIALPNGDGLTKEGFVFAGWTIKGSSDGTVYKGNYPVSGAVTFVAAWTEEGSVPAGGTFADFVGANNSSSAVKYGYASVSDAQADNNAISATTTAGTTNTFYYASAYYATGTQKLLIYIYYKSSTGVSATTDKNGQNISDINVDVFEVYVGSSSYPSKFAVNFAIQDGKRTMTISYGGQSVTWEEITA